MKRFFIEEIHAEKGVCTIEGPEARHIAKVMRMGPGERFILMDRGGSRYQALIESSTHRRVRVVLEKPLGAPPPSPVDITLCQAVVKSRAMDAVIRQSSELGVREIIPFISERTVVRPDSRRGYEAKNRHWREIARNAAKQSDRGTPTIIGQVMDFRDLSDSWKGREGFKVILWEGEKTRDLRGLFAQCSSMPRFVGIIGPEGGFAPNEISAALEAGFVAATLGPRILRAETAALALLAVVQYEWGDLSTVRDGPEKRTSNTEHRTSNDESKTENNTSE